MNTLTLENKEYIVLPKKEYEDLIKAAAIKVSSAKIVPLEEGKKLAHELIDKWAKEK
jgi:hypothetical protein